MRRNLCILSVVNLRNLSPRQTVEDHLVYACNTGHFLLLLVLMKIKAMALMHEYGTEKINKFSHDLIEWRSRYKGCIPISYVMILFIAFLVSL